MWAKLSYSPSYLWHTCSHKASSQPNRELSNPEGKITKSIWYYFGFTILYHAYSTIRWHWLITRLTIIVVIAFQKISCYIKYTVYFFSISYTYSHYYIPFSSSVSKFLLSLLHIQIKNILLNYSWLFKVMNQVTVTTAFTPSPAGCVCVQSLQSCPTFCNPMDWGPPGSSAHGILQAGTLEGVAMPSSRGFSWPGDWTHVCLHLLHCRQIR